MRWVMIGLGILLTLVGVVWILQGIGIMLDSPMTGQPFWAWMGLLVLIGAAALLFFGVRRGVAARRP
jgi:LPXTG-motif cell wall-anchored protein